MLFTQRGVTPTSTSDIEACVELLADERLRARFEVQLKRS